jgi:hypothetical protein
MIRCILDFLGRRGLLAPKELLTAIDPWQWILLAIVLGEGKLVDALHQDREGARWRPRVLVWQQKVHLGELRLVEVVKEPALQVIYNLRDSR